MSPTPLSLITLLHLTPLASPTTLSALRSPPPYLSALAVSPGLHLQNSQAPRLHSGEFPACAAMTTGHVFRVENPATVLFLQRVGRTGRLTRLEVSVSAAGEGEGLKGGFGFGYVEVAEACSGVALAVLVGMGEGAAVAYLFVLVLIGVINVSVLRRQILSAKWHGASEPGTKGDLLVLLSYDRWIRLQGQVDDLKAVTSGAWMREGTLFEEALLGFATCCAYLAPGLLAHAELRGQIIVLALLGLNAALLGLEVWGTRELRMKGRVVRLLGERKGYESRRVLARELIEEYGGRRDWAMGLGLVTGEEKVVAM